MKNSTKTKRISITEPMIETRWIGRDDENKYHIGLLKTHKDQPADKYILEHGKLIKVKPESLKIY